MSEPNRNEEQKRNEATAGGLIRLGCCYCDRTDCDGIDAFPTDWTNIQPVTKAGLHVWETHLGICPSCQKYDDDFASSGEGTPPWEESTQTPDEPLAVHPIIMQIIDCDCHVGTSNREVVRHVISKLKHGYETFRSMPQAHRKQLIEQTVQHHRRNFKEYVEVMSGFTRSTQSKLAGLPHSLSGKQIVSLMRKHGKTIEALSFRMGISQKRIRQVREKGLTDVLAIRDWMEAITGTDPGPIPKRIRIGGIQEEGSCCFCGYPLYSGDEAFEYVGSMFCSTTCCRKSRGW